MIVYTLFHETNTGHSDESDGYVEAIFATEAEAEAARLVVIRLAMANGQNVYFDPETEIDYPDTWEHDWRVEAHELKTAEQAIAEVVDLYRWEMAS